MTFSIVEVINRNSWGKGGVNSLFDYDKLRLSDASYKIVIKGYNGNENDVTIPATIEGLPVTHIGRSVFRNKQTTSVTFPDSVTTIYDQAFDNCTLIRITIGANVIFSDTTFSEGNDNIGFSIVYRSEGRAAGTYTRPDANSQTWTKQ
jgi:hypothetical protein